MTTILVTGASGNLGSALLPRLSAPSDARLLDARALDARHFDARALDARHFDARALDAPHFDARALDAPHFDARALDAPPLDARPFDVRPMSRRERPGWVAADLSTGTGVSEAVRGADVVVHLASSPTKTRSTDVEGTRRLAAAASEAGVRHFVYMSIIGIDRVPLPYYRMKLAAEEVVRESGVPFTLLRAAQFPTLIDSFLTASSRLGPLLIDRRLVFQPVAVEDVADRIATLVAAPPAGKNTSPTRQIPPRAGEITPPTREIAPPAGEIAPPAGDVVELAGPSALTLAELANEWKQARNTRRPIWPIHVPGRFGRELRAGALTSTATPRGTRTWSEYLTSRYHAAR
ncbi:NAD(P)H-binding protein [Actinoplanes sp. NBRC 103695]|uniref:SDR family oxidoreductase n=1 Tax=Actinoplanes sp. NBRC 103695 TaxID=3032202 RepID=UPI00255606B4|nr:NAD(P)H-binding protein [Actinoplanes sp. NBRC 103695]GLY99174.1 hypothetical protein Acsp02_64280 [Actinoplanes sp. NBRC 103695]